MWSRASAAHGGGTLAHGRRPKRAEVFGFDLCARAVNVGPPMWKDKIADYVVKNGPGLAEALLVIMLGVIAARMLGDLLLRWLDKRQMEPPVKRLLSRVLRLLVVALSVVIAAGTCGVNIAPLVAGIGVAGVGVGLAMQGVLSNLVSGLVIIFTKPFRVGEYVEIIGCYGQVTTIELFSTVLL